MAETIDSASPPGESTKPLAEVENLPAVETASAPAAADSSLPAMDTSLPEIDSTLPAMDTSLPPVDPSLPSIESSLPQFDSSVPALPSIDTSLPTLDTTLPATDSMLHDTESHSFLDDTRQDDTQGPQPGTAQGASNDGLPQQTDSYASDPAYQNGAYQYSQQPAQQQQQQPQSQPLPQDQQQPQQIEQSQPQEQQHQQQHHHHHHQQQQYQPQHQYQPQQYQQQPQQQQQQQQPYQPQQQYQQQYQQQSPEMYNQQAGHPPGTMQAMDHNGVQGQSHIPQAPIGSPMPSNIPPMPSVGQYMTGYPTSVSPMNMNSNYQLPGDPNKMLSSGRHKKEVKRRTKTGCLTCRKRRIKCDEGHPVCRNCVKSKRDCLGYDPVFRPQSTTPSAIQPAPNPPSLVISPQEPGPYPAAPPGYVPAASQPFAPSLQSESSAQSSTEHNQFDYGAAIDPALEAHNNSGNMASVQHATNATDGGLQTSINAGTTGTDTGFRVKQVQISDLLALRGIAPPPPHPVTSLPPGRLEEIQAVFLATYAPAIDRFFETPWFQEKALPHAMANAQLMAEYSALIDAFNDRNLEDPNVIARLESFEASVIWSTITLCRHVMNMSNGSHGQDFDLLAAVRRLDVIEALLAGDHMETNPLAQFPVRQPAADPPALTMQITQRSLDFWSCVGHFLTLHDNEASSAKEIDDTLGRCRTVLDTTENRDVIYSIAIARHVGQRWADFPHSIPQPSTTNEKDAGAKLYVAQKFLEQQAAGSGTTQVSKRICGMAVRSWFVSRQ